MEQDIINKKIHLVILGQDASILDESSEAAQRTRSYAKSFSGISVYVFARKIPQNKARYDNVFVTGFSTLLKSFFSFVQIYKDIRSLKRKKIQVLISTQDPFEIGLAGFFLSRITQAAFHVQVHTDISSQYMRKESVRARIQVCIASFVLKKADRIRAVSKRIKEFCVNRYKIESERIDYVPMMYADSQHKDVNNSTDLTGGKKIFLVPTRFVPLKRVPYIIDAFAAATKHDDSVRLRIVGSGPNKKEILDAIEKNNISNQVELIPWVNDMGILYKDAYAVLVASLYEGWCRVASESVMHHIPVIMTDVGCANEWLEDKKQGLVIPIENKSAFISAITDIINKEDLHRSLVLGCITKSQTIPSFSSYTKQIITSWLEAISQTK